jgi:hypothetical protein
MAAWKLKTYKYDWEKVDLPFWLRLCFLEVDKDWKVWPPKFPISES